jgi:type II secretory pathway predicted ATPase ExeA
MYKEYFGFKNQPFCKDISTEDLFHYEGFGRYESSMDLLKKHGGIGVLWGGAGSGKSAALRWLDSQLNENLYRFCYLPYPPNSTTELYRSIAVALDLQPAYRRMDIYRQIQEHIAQMVQDRKITPVIALDECQMYSHQVLEAVRLFLNFEFDSRDYVILLLCGQTEFRKRLRYAVYEPLVQRVTTQHQFTGLTAGEIKPYLTHRLAVAGVAHPLFEPAAAEFIYQVTKGVFRKIDLLCVQSLQRAAEEKMKTVDQPTVEQALKQNFWA